MKFKKEILFYVVTGFYSGAPRRRRAEHHGLEKLGNA